MEECNLGVGSNYKEIWYGDPRFIACKMVWITFVCIGYISMMGWASLDLGDSDSPCLHIHWRWNARHFELITNHWIDFSVWHCSWTVEWKPLKEINKFSYHDPGFDQFDPLIFQVGHRKPCKKQTTLSSFNCEDQN